MCVGECPQTGHMARTGMNWKLEPITVFKEYEVKIVYDELNSVIYKPTIDST